MLAAENIGGHDATQGEQSCMHTEFYVYKEYIQSWNIHHGWQTMYVYMLVSYCTRLNESVELSNGRDELRNEALQGRL